jgi:hypothetical protein
MFIKGFTYGWDGRGGDYRTPAAVSSMEKFRQAGNEWLLGFLYHGILGIADEDYQRAWSSVGRRTEFFNYLRAALRYALHESWQSFLVFVRGDVTDG